jgi:hypothetical protein
LEDTREMQEGGAPEESMWTDELVHNQCARTKRGSPSKEYYSTTTVESQCEDVPTDTLLGMARPSSLPPLDDRLKDHGKFGLNVLAPAEKWAIERAPPDRRSLRSAKDAEVMKTKTGSIRAGLKWMKPRAPGGVVRRRRGRPPRRNGIEGSNKY